MARMAFPAPAADEVVILHLADASVTCDNDGPKFPIQKSIYPRYTVPSQSVAGTIVQVGENVTRFASGQRVMAYRQLRKAGNSSDTGSQQHSTVSEALVCALPDSLNLNEAHSLPLSVTLAAVGLYQRNHLNLPLPRAHSGTREEREEYIQKVILIIDGASEIGALATQLATASGLRVIATASKNDANFVTSLGASLVVDDQDPSAARGELVAALDMGTMQFSGIFDTRSTEQSCAQIDALLQDIAQSPRVCAVNPPPCPPKSFVPTVAISSTINRSPHTFIRSAIWGQYLPEALACGRLRVRSEQTASHVKANGALGVGDNLERQRSDSAVVMSSSC